jgi:nucleoside 2-deoxyribosyltransferase
MGILNKTKAYSVGPMEYGEGSVWRNRAAEILNPIGITVLDPYKKPFDDAPVEDKDTHIKLHDLMESKDFDAVHSHMKKIRQLDLSMVDRADFIICYLDPKVPTYGSVEELAVAADIKRPVFIAIEGGKSKCPLWVMGMFPHKYIYNSLDEVFETILKIDSGEIIADSNRWRLLKPHLR